MTEIRERLLRDIAAERTRQDTKFGAAAERGYSAAMWLSVLAEEVGEAAKEVNDAAVGSALLHELVQVAAVAVAFAEATIANIEAIHAGIPNERWTP